MENDSIAHFRFCCCFFLSHLPVIVDRALCFLQSKTRIQRRSVILVIIIFTLVVIFTILFIHSSSERSGDGCSVLNGTACTTHYLRVMLMLFLLLTDAVVNVQCSNNNNSNDYSNDFPLPRKLAKIFSI